MTPEEAKDIARRFVDEVWNRRDLHHAATRLPIDPAAGSSAARPSGLQRSGVERFRSLLDASADLRVEIIDLVSDGGNVAIRARFIGTDTGGVFPGAGRTGKRFDLEGIDVFVVDDEGTFVEHEGMVDMRAAMDQLGLVSAPSAGPQL